MIMARLATIVLDEAMQGFEECATVARYLPEDAAWFKPSTYDRESQVYGGAISHLVNEPAFTFGLPPRPENSEWTSVEEKDYLAAVSKALDEHVDAFCRDYLPHLRRVAAALAGAEADDGSNTTAESTGATRRKR